MNEFNTIQKYFLPLTKGNKSANYLQDDTASVTIESNKELIISKDLMAEDVHFRISYGGYNIAKKLLLSNLSDIASSGAKPLYYMLGFSKNIDENFTKEFCRGLKDVGDQFDLSLIGGDTIKTIDKLCFSITIFGEIDKGKSLKRNNAKDGDLIFVSGNIGDAYLGINILENGDNPQPSINENYQQYLINRHLCPIPRVAMAMELVKNNLSKSATDISDGLLADLLHICQASKLDAIILQKQIPISVAAKYVLKKNNHLNLQQLLSGGEDYELIFTAPKNYRKEIDQLSTKLKIKVTCIGRMQKTKQQPQIHLLDKNKQSINIQKYGYVC